MKSVLVLVIIIAGWIAPALWFSTTIYEREKSGNVPLHPNEEELQKDIKREDQEYTNECLKGNC